MAHAPTRDNAKGVPFHPASLGIFAFRQFGAKTKLTVAPDGLQCIAISTDRVVERLDQLPGAVADGNRGRAH